MTRQRGNQHCQGFTITEILVGVAITTLMVALMLPAVNRSRSETRTLQGLNNLQQIGQAVHLYAVDNYNTLPIGYWDGNTPSGVIGVPAKEGVETDWLLTINAYLTGAPNNYKEIADLGDESAMLSIFRDPNADVPDQGLYHYLGHPLLMPDQSIVERKDPTETIYDSVFKHVLPYKLSRFRRPHEVVLVMDGIQDAGHQVNFTCYRALAENIENEMFLPPKNDAMGDFNGYYDPAANDNNSVINPGPNNISATANIRWRQRNDTEANFLFSDGHTETLRQADRHPNGAPVSGTGEVFRRHFRVDK